MKYVQVQAQMNSKSHDSQPEHTATLNKAEDTHTKDDRGSDSHALMR